MPIVACFFFGVAGVHFLLTLTWQWHATKNARAAARARKVEAAKKAERLRPKYVALSRAQPPATDVDLVAARAAGTQKGYGSRELDIPRGPWFPPAQVAALAKPDDVERELARFRIWREAADGACPRCDGRGAVGKCAGGDAGAKDGFLPCGCEICHVCGGSGTTERRLSEIGETREADDRPCQICFCGSSFKLSTGCDHFYCADCIKGSLEVAAPRGKEPPRSFGGAASPRPASTVNPRRRPLDLLHRP